MAGNQKTETIRVICEMEITYETDGGREHLLREALTLPAGLDGASTIHGTYRLRRIKTELADAG